MERFVVGLAKKMVIADPLGEIADKAFALPVATLSGSDAWLGLLCYTLQIYFDFSGYSDMAIGLARMFGFAFLRELQLPVRVALGHGFLAAMAHLAVALVPRLSLHSARRQPARRRAHLRQSGAVFLCAGCGTARPGPSSSGARSTASSWSWSEPGWAACSRARRHFVARAYTLLVVALAWVVFRSPTLAGGMGYYAALLRPDAGNFPRIYPGNFTWLVLACALLGATGAFTWLTRDWRARAGQLRGRVDPALAEMREGALVLGARNVILLGLMVLCSCNSLARSITPSSISFLGDTRNSSSLFNHMTSRDTMNGQVADYFDESLYP